MSEKKYMAQEMREEADYCDSVAKETENIQKIGLEEDEAIPECFHRTICNMLRQAADTEEENANLRDIINEDSASMADKDAVIKKLKARLEAVVKECANQRQKIAEVKDIDAPLAYDLGLQVDAILRAVRGDNEERNES